MPRDRVFTAAALAQTADSGTRRRRRYPIDRGDISEAQTRKRRKRYTTYPAGDVAERVRAGGVTILTKIGQSPHTA